MEDLIETPLYLNGLEALNMTNEPKSEPHYLSKSFCLYTQYIIVLTKKISKASHFELEGL